MTILNNGAFDAEHDSFFKWVPADEYRMTTDPEGTEQAVHGLVVVDKLLRQEYATTVDANDPLPEDGAYVVTVDGDGLVYAFRYLDLDTARADFLDAYGEYFEGEDQPITETGEF